jgi:hypothetical protein
MLSNNADILALTETWLGTSVDKPVFSEITPNGYSIHQIARNGKTGGTLTIPQRMWCFSICLSEMEEDGRSRKVRNDVI